MDNKKEPSSNTGAKRVRWPSIIPAIILGLGAIAALHVSGKFLRPQLLVYILWLVPVWILLRRMKRVSDSKLDSNISFLPLTIIALLLMLSLFSGNRRSTNPTCQPMTKRLMQNWQTRSRQRPESGWSTPQNTITKYATGSKPCPTPPFLPFTLAMTRGLKTSFPAAQILII